MDPRLKTLYRLLFIIPGIMPMALFAATLPTPADTSPTVQIPASTEAARAGQNLPTPTALPSNQNLGYHAPVFQTTAPAAGAQNVKFVLHQLQIIGNTVFSYQQLLPLFQHYLNQQVSLADLQNIAEKITLKYRNAGYILSKALIPAQTIQSGIVKIQVIEGYIEKVEVNGEAGSAKPLLQKYGNALQHSGPLNNATLEKYSLFANDIPGMTAKTVLQVPTDPNAPPGAVDALLVPQFSKANGFISYDNRGTKYLGPNEISAGGAINSLLQAGDQVGVQGLATPHPNQLQYLNAYTKQPLFATGAIFDLTGSYSRTVPGFLLAPLQVEGRSQEITPDIQIPLIRSRQQSLYITPSFDYLNNRTDINRFNANFFDDHIRSARLGANYYLNDSWQGANQLGLQVSKGLPILGASQANAPDLSRVGANPEYIKFNGSISRLQGITSHISLYVAGIAQYTQDPLLSAEQFSYGGSQYGQAYDPSEITGDKGAAGRTELRYNVSPDWKYLNSAQLFTFYDIGKIWNVLPQVKTALPQEASGASTGAGTRLNFNQYIYGSLVYAVPLTREVATEKSFAPRIFGSITLSGKTPPEESSNALSNAINAQPVGYTSGQATNGPSAQVSATQGGD